MIPDMQWTATALSQAATPLTAAPTIFGCVTCGTNPDAVFLVNGTSYCLEHARAQINPTEDTHDITRDFSPIPSFVSRN